MFNERYGRFLLPPLKSDDRVAPPFGCAGVLSAVARVQRLHSAVLGAPFEESSITKAPAPTHLLD